MSNSNTSPDPSKEQMDYASKLWAGEAEALIQAQNRILNYLFVLNTGGFVATTTSLSKGNSECSLVISFLAFVCGTMFIVLHATFFYYVQQSNYKQTKDLVERFITRTISYSDFYAEVTSRKWFYGIAYFLALTSAFLLIAGIVSGAVSLLQ